MRDCVPMQKTYTLLCAFSIGVWRRTWVKWVAVRRLVELEPRAALSTGGQSFTFAEAGGYIRTRRGT